MMRILPFVAALLEGRRLTAQDDKVAFLSAFASLRWMLPIPSAQTVAEQRERDRSDLDPVIARTSDGRLGLVTLRLAPTA